MHENKLVSKKIFELQFHIDRINPESKELLMQIRRHTLGLSGQVVENILKQYIGYGLGLTKTSRLQRTFLQVEPQNTRLRLYLRSVNYSGTNDLPPN